MQLPTLSVPPPTESDWGAEVAEAETEGVTLRQVPAERTFTPADGEGADTFVRDGTRLIDGRGVAGDIDDDVL